MMRIHRIWVGLGMVLLMVGCDSEIVDVDELANGKSLTGTWTLDCDSVGDGTMEIRYEENCYHGTAWIEDSTYSFTGIYIVSSNTMNSLSLFPEFGSVDPRGFMLDGTVHPSEEMVRGVLTVYTRRWDIVRFTDSVTATKQ